MSSDSHCADAESSDCSISSIQAKKRKMIGKETGRQATLGGHRLVARTLCDDFFALAVGWRVHPYSLAIE